MLAPAGWTDVRIEAWLDWLDHQDCSNTSTGKLDPLGRPFLGRLDAWAGTVAGRCVELGLLEDPADEGSVSRGLVQTILSGMVAPGLPRSMPNILVQSMDDPASIRKIKTSIAERRLASATSGVIDAAARALNAVADAVDRCEGPRGECATPRKNPALARAALKARQAGASDAAILASIAGERLSLQPAAADVQSPFVIVADRDTVAAGGPDIDLLGQAALTGELVLAFDPADGEAVAHHLGAATALLNLPVILQIEDASHDLLADLVRLWTVALAGADRTGGDALRLGLGGLTDVVLAEGLTTATDIEERLSRIAGNSRRRSTEGFS